MLDRVRIWDDEAGNVHYEVKDSDGVPFIHTCMTSTEWKALRDKQIDTYPGNVTVSMLTDYLAVLDDVVSE